jgi:hypothetical protein
LHSKGLHKRVKELQGEIERKEKGEVGAGVRVTSVIIEQS